jgi:hypothetical protein
MANIIFAIMVELVYKNTREGLPAEVKGYQPTEAGYT